MPELPPRPRVGRWAPLLALVALVLAASLTNLDNRFTQDDIPIIERNAAVHSPAFWHHFAQSYWPRPFTPDLYRPLTSTWFGLQWLVGGGQPEVYHVVSILMYLATTLLLWQLARRLLSPTAAWIAAALFAVHPVHVESVAIGVGQAELAVGLLLTLGVLRYLQFRAQGPTLSPRAMAELIAIYLAACLFKESGVMLPVLLVAAELTVAPADGTLWRRLTALRPFGLGLALVGVAFIAVRSQVLHDVVGSFTAEALRGLSLGGRAVTMLAVVPEWTRLLLWPAHLQADYSPQEIVASTGFGWAEGLGLMLLLAGTVTVLAARRRAPALSFGLIWVAIGIFPVSNVLVPTGIVLAERTLFLPSIGMMLALGAVVPWVEARLALARAPFRRLALGGLALLLVAGAARSAQRQKVWYNQLQLFRQTVVDAPLSYRAHYALADILFQIEHPGLGETEYREAIRLYPKSFAVYKGLADRYRLGGHCYPALPLYHQALALEPGLSEARASLVACLMYIGHYAEARSHARIGVAYEHNQEHFQRWVVEADSALAAAAPAGSVRVTLDDPSNPALTSIGAGSEPEE